jgi:inosine-uridine nucleoside N-ribohydrolase
VPLVIDTDASNEIDDQFALVHALLSPERLDVQAVYAAPYVFQDSEFPGEGMEKSHEEIHRIFHKMALPSGGRIFHGADAYLADYCDPPENEAALDLIRRANAMADGPLYVVAIGAGTNVAAAMLLDPSIIGRIVVIWLAGHAFHWRNADDYNLKQDLMASRLIFDCGVPLIQVPCRGVASHLITTVSEVERYVAGRGAIGDYLAAIFTGYHADHFAWSKILWDMAPIGWLIDPFSVSTEIIHSPIVTHELTWSFDRSRHFIRSATFVERDPIFQDFFHKLDVHASG